MTLKFNALNIFILILYGILDFYFLDFRIAWNFFIIIIVIISFSGFFLIVTYVKRFWIFYSSSTIQIVDHYHYHYFLLNWREITSSCILFCLFHLPLTGKPIFLALQQILLEARIESSKTELSHALKTTALKKGFVISDNQGEGNCMFFALSEQLDLIKGIQMSHDELRRTIVQHLRENPRLVSTLLFFLRWIYLQYMRKPSHFPSEIFLLFLRLKAIRSCSDVSEIRVHT